MSAGELSRRQFLLRTGWIAAGTTVFASCSWVPVLPSFRDPDLEDSCLWIQALSDGRIRFYCPKSEMGQGILTGLTQIVAEELNVPTASVEVVLPNSSQIPPARMTVGSFSVSGLFDPLSTAAATLRETLRARAAARVDATPDDIADAEGGFSLPDGSFLAYAALAADATMIEADPGRANADLPRYALARRGRHREIGRRSRQKGIEAVVTGHEVYSRDVSVPGMAYARVFHPPRFGARLAGVHASAARAIPGVVDIVVASDRRLVAVAAEDPFALEPAARALAPSWDGGESLSQTDIDGRLDAESSEDFEHEFLDEGDLERGATESAVQLSATYSNPFLAHAAMEPRAGIAWVRDDAVEVWSASQDPWYVRSAIARIVDRPEEDVVVHSHRIGGAFGGRLRCQAAEEAAWLSNELERAVRVQWTREDEFRHNYVQPQFSHRIEAGADAQGRIRTWDHAFSASPILLNSTMIPEHLHWLADIPGDPGTSRAAEPLYAVPNRRVRYSDVRLPVPTGAWRGLGSAPNTFATESAIDELAHQAGVDPLEFRLRNLGPEREGVANALRAVAELSGWGRETPDGVGLGVACSSYHDKTHVAVVAEVAVDGEGAVRVRRVFCAHDCGLVINPDQVENQIEGNIVWGCSMALYERAEIADGQFVADNFHTYPILRNDAAPDILIRLIESTAPPAGAGEPAISPTPPAITNALYAASGRRVRHLPIPASA